ncbi:MAG: aminopeptidase P family protein [Muribaculaceae bacterium]|nr:aminopeptidase P family protein [Muribaculaceae bacterium]
MDNVYVARLDALRNVMREAGIAAVVVPQADPHLGEYLAAHWQVRRWLSGFTGSAGDLVVTLDRALLWTDSRYFIQAAAQLDGSGIELMKDGLAETPSIAAFLCSALPAGSRVGVDGMLFSAPALEALASRLESAGIDLDCHFDPVGRLWSDRPALPDGKIFVHDSKYAGQSARRKIEDVLGAVKGEGAAAVFVSALDEIAWILNIRCNDVRHTPVATSYLYLSEADKVLFIAEAKLTDETRAYLASEGVRTQDYGAVTAFLAALPESVRVLVDPARTSGAVMDILGSRAVATAVSPAAVMKSVKNDVQIAGVRDAMVRDGVALVKAFMEIERRMADGEATTELDVAALLHEYRSQGDLYFDESFGTIAGYADHGAIVHYEADAASNAQLQPRGLLLVDSGAQYLDGTTDITRTIALGEPTAEEKRDFTLVMKGHIALANTVFPAGTRGAQLDAIARQFLWKNGLSYLHGTGHGVGHFLSVHEGPHSIRLNNVEAPLLPGSITSNEPGLYREGVHGIRCENLVLCRELMETEFGTFLGFEILTLFPFDRSLFDTSIMTEEEVAWVDNYHALVRERLWPALENAAQRAWLDVHTAPLATV